MCLTKILIMSMDRNSFRIFATSNELYENLDLMKFSAILYVNFKASDITPCMSKWLLYILFQLAVSLVILSMTPNAKFSVPVLCARVIDMMADVVTTPLRKRKQLSFGRCYATGH